MVITNILNHTSGSKLILTKTNQRSAYWCVERLPTRSESKNQTPYNDDNKHYRLFQAQFVRC